MGLGGRAFRNPPSGVTGGGCRSLGKRSTRQSRAVREPLTFNCMVSTGGKLCGRRVAKLYRAGHLFACRHCLGLVYASQQEIPVRRAMRRAQKIKMRLGGSDDPLEPFPQKPRGMHRRTYRRLREQARAADADADGLLAESMPGLGQFLGSVPPRRKRQRGRRDGGQ